MSSQNSISSRMSRTRGSRVSPGDTTDLIDGMEMGSIEEKKNNHLNASNNKALKKVKAVVKNKFKGSNPINLITNLKQQGKRWKEYATTRRKNKTAVGGDPSVDRRRAGGEGLAAELGPDRPPRDAVDGTITPDQREHRKIHNRNLIQYFAEMGRREEPDACLNLDYIEEELLSGADINCTDKYGQSVLHEAARAWDVDVARFLIDECHADINIADDKGRTPLHVAAAVDYPEMVIYLIDANANREAETWEEKQTPVHFAARNDACLSLKALIKKGCLYKEVRDYKGRTPLHVAAELDRSETAKTLLELDDPAPAGVEDESGQAAIVWMITKMPPVAKIALDQFHTKDRANRKQFFYLNWLEPRKPDDERPVYPQTAIQVAVAYHRLDLIIHPVMQRLNDIKWKRFGRLWATISTVLNLAFIITWTTLGVLVDYNARHNYILPDHWWRILLLLMAILLTAWQIKEELSEFISSKKAYSQWQKWRREEIERDLKYAHPRWPEEAQYLQQEIDSLEKTGPQYFNDFWNIFDWICYALLLVCIITHLVDVGYHTNFIARLHIRIMAITIILIWLRLMKNARAFSLLGPFIVIISHMVSDVAKFLFLYIEFFIPFACAFYMIFGGEKVPEQFQGLPGAANNTATVNGMENFPLLLFTLFRLTLVDEYDYDGLKAIDSAMCHLLLVLWFALSAILMLNLFIALMSDTFVRVYDKSNANAVMQKAITILSIEDGLSTKRKRRFKKFIHSECSPEKDFYDDDTTDESGEDLKKTTIQIKEELEEFVEEFQEYMRKETEKKAVDYMDCGKSDDNLDDDDDDDGDRSVGHKRGKKKSRAPVSVRRFEKEMDDLHEAVSDLAEQQNQMAEKVKRDMNQIKTMLQQIAMTAMREQVQAPPTEAPPKSPVLPPIKPQAFKESRHVYNKSPSVEIDGPPQILDLTSSSQVLARRPPTRASLLEMGTPRSGTMDFGESSVFASPPVVARQQSSVTTSLPPHTEEDWATLERKRQDDLKKLRQKLSHQQQQAVVHSSKGRVQSVTTEDDGASDRADDRDSVYTDSTIVHGNNVDMEKASHRY